MTPLIKQFPWLSWILFLIVYAVFGWLIASDEDSWTKVLFEHLRIWGVHDILTDSQSLLRTVIVNLLEVSFVFLLIFFFSDFFSLLESICKTPFASNILTFGYIVFWALLVSVVLSWISYFTRLLILLAAALLLRTDMQRLDMNHLQTCIIIRLSGIVAFILGTVAFKIWGVNVQSV